MRNLYKNEQSGRSMVEMLGVLAIIGVLSVGGIAGYSKAMAKYRINQTLDQISMLVMNIRSLYSASVDYSGLTSTVAIQMGIIPRNMLPAGETEATATAIVNAYQGSVFLSEANTGGNGRSFKVAYTGLTREACVSIASSDWGAQAGSGLIHIGITAGALASLEASTKGTKEFSMADFPITLAEAAAYCTDTTDTGNAIIWEYY